MNRKQQVFLKLKPKAKQFGFNVKELKGIAAQIADNLTSADDASDEDVNTEIDEEIDNALKYLPFAQSQANRVLDEWKKNNPSAKDDDDDDVDDDYPVGGQKGSKGKNPKNKGSKSDDEPAWFKEFREQQEARFAVLEAEKVSSSRKSRLEEILKGTGAFGTRTLKSFAKMKFENDDEFEDFLSDVGEDLKAFNQERADAGLAQLGAPSATSVDKPKGKEELITDEEIDAIVKSL